MRTADPLLDYEIYEADQERRLSELPVCVVCGDPIQDFEAYNINGDWVRESCIEECRQVVNG